MRRNEKKLRERQMLIKWSKQCQVCQGLDDSELHTIISILQGRKLRLKEGKRLGTTMPVLFSRGHFKYLKEKFLSNINVPTPVINLVYFYFYFHYLSKGLENCRDFCEIYIANKADKLCSQYSWSCFTAYLYWVEKNRLLA